MENEKLMISSLDNNKIGEEVLSEIRKSKTALIEYLSGFKNETYTKISKVRESESYVMSSAQRRLWVLCQLEEGNAAYNMSGVHVFEGVLEVGCLSS
ncbi:hypothetical protein ACFFGT_19120, partial [Mucilaginibacter angelicae]